MCQHSVLYFEKIILHPIRPTTYKAHIFLVKIAYNFVKKGLQGEASRLPWFLDLPYKTAISVQTPMLKANNYL